jgi:hypothetical protein
MQLVIFLTCKLELSVKMCVIRKVDEKMQQPGSLLLIKTALTDQISPPYLQAILTHVL